MDSKELAIIKADGSARNPIEAISRLEIEKRNLADEVERLTAERDKAIGLLRDRTNYCCRLEAERDNAVASMVEVTRQVAEDVEIGEGESVVDALKRARAKAAEREAECREALSCGGYPVAQGGDIAAAIRLMASSLSTIWGERDALCGARSEMSERLQITAKQVQFFRNRLHAEIEANAMRCAGGCADEPEDFDDAAE